MAIEELSTGLWNISGRRRLLSWRFNGEEKCQWFFVSALGKALKCEQAWEGNLWLVVAWLLPSLGEALAALEIG